MCANARALLCLDFCFVQILYFFYLESSRERLLQLLKADRRTLRCMKPWRCVCCFFFPLFFGSAFERRGEVLWSSTVQQSAAVSRRREFSQRNAASFHCLSFPRVSLLLSHSHTQTASFAFRVCACFIPFLLHCAERPVASHRTIQIVSCQQQRSFFTELVTLF